MSYKRLKQEYRASASKLHRKLGDILRVHPTLGGLRINQEWPIPDSPYFVDWFIKDINLAIEVHGEQHERPVAFDGDKDASVIRFAEQVERDKKKKELCKELGWKLVEFWYDEPINIDTVSAKILKCLGDANGAGTPRQDARGPR
jgi:very-short-patch-repair endonuclease